ncbi:30S ribosomal protein S18, partial [Modestobacter versicolor]
MAGRLPAGLDRARAGHRVDKATGVDYKDTTLLRKFISDRGKIRARRVSGNCSQHQRDVAV